MAVKYTKLFKRLLDMDIKKLAFAEMVGISGATLAKLSGNKYVALDVVEKICLKLDCTPNDILEFVHGSDTGAGQ